MKMEGRRGWNFDKANRIRFGLFYVSERELWGYGEAKKRGWLCYVLVFVSEGGTRRGGCVHWGCLVRLRNEPPDGCSCVIAAAFDAKCVLDVWGACIMFILSDQIGRRTVYK